MISSSIVISEFNLLNLSSFDLESLIKDSLRRSIADKISNEMTITEEVNVSTGERKYTGTINTTSDLADVCINGSSNNGTITISPHTGNVSIGTVTPSSSMNITSSAISETLRVVEYTKNNKITRVELQRYDIFNSSWIKVQRIQIEE